MNELLPLPTKLAFYDLGRLRRCHLPSCPSTDSDLLPSVDGHGHFLQHRLCRPISRVLGSCRLYVGGRTHLYAAETLENSIAPFDGQFGGGV
jgi:hypothetical protein